MKTSQIFHDSTRNFHDPWVGTDTPGPGEAVFVIRFIEKPLFTIKNPNFQTKKINITKLKIARNHVVGFGRKSMEKLPTSLPELFRPTRDQHNRQTEGKTWFLLPKKNPKKY